jgi:hypothetical protein
MIAGPDNTFVGTGDSNGPEGALEQIPRKEYLGRVYQDGSVDPHDPLVFRRWVGR